MLPIASRGVKRRRPRLRPQVTVVIALRGPVVLPWPAGPTSPLDVSTALLTSVQTLHHNP